MLPATRFSLESKGSFAVLGGCTSGEHAVFTVRHVPKPTFRIFHSHVDADVRSTRLAFLDRTNVGNAKIQGMTEDLNMTGDDYNVALFTFFITYILFEVKFNDRPSQ